MVAFYPALHSCKLMAPASDPYYLDLNPQIPELISTQSNKLNGDNASQNLAPYQLCSQRFSSSFLHLLEFRAYSVPPILPCHLLFHWNLSLQNCCHCTCSSSAICPTVIVPPLLIMEDNDLCVLFNWVHKLSTWWALVPDGWPQSAC